MKSGKEEILRNRKIYWIAALGSFAALMISLACLSLILGAWKEYSVGIVFSIFLFLFFVSIGGVFYSHKKLNDYRVSHLYTGVPRLFIEENVVYRFLGKHHFSRLGLCAALDPIKNEDADNMGKSFFVQLGDLFYNSIIGKLKQDDLFVLLDPEGHYVIEDSLQVVDNEILPKGEATLTISNDYGGKPYVLKCDKDGIFTLGTYIGTYRVNIFSFAEGKDQDKAGDDKEEKNEN